MPEQLLSMYFRNIGRNIGTYGSQIGIQLEIDSISGAASSSAFTQNSMGISCLLSMSSSSMAFAAFSFLSASSSAA